MRISTFFLILIVPFLSFSQFNSPSLTDGGVQPGEYGTHVQGQNLHISSGQNWYCTWDNDSVYFAVAGGFNPANDAVNIFIDIDPVIPVNSNSDADGSVEGINFDRTDARLPFRADAFLFVKQSYDDYRTAAGNGGFTGRLGSIAKNIGFGTANYVELGIAWSKLTGAGRPAAFNFFGYISYDNGGFNGVFAPAPEGNPTHASGGQVINWFIHYYSVINTDNGTATAPFSLQSFTYREWAAGGYFMPSGDFFDVTVHQNSSTDSLENESSVGVYDNLETDNRLLVGGDSLDTLNIGRHVYVGVNSALVPADNSGGINDPRGAVLRFTGPACRLYNFGRIDANPEAGTLDDIARRKMYIEVLDTLTLMPTNNLIFYRYRLGDITVFPGAVLQADPTAAIPAPLGFDYLEAQWGTMDVQGKVNLGDGTAGSFQFGLRGSWNPSPDNRYMITSSGGTPEINLYHLQLGNWTSFLSPDTSETGPALTLNLHGDFRNFSNFEAVNGTGELNLRFAGLGEQKIMGTIGETGEPTKAVAPAPGASPTVALPLEVRFNDIEIDNSSGMDVVFESFEPTIPTGTNIAYKILGELKLTNGDLVTRNRANPNAARAVHTVTIVDTAPVPVFTGARSDIGMGISSFVDGPLSYEVNQTGAFSREFPVGKTNGIIGDYRHLNLALNCATNSNAVYTAEMFLEDRSNAYAFPTNPCPDILGRISTVRYWNVEATSLVGLTNAIATVDYDTNEADDEVTNAMEVRLLKEVGPDCENVSCGQGGTANGKGSISSLAITDFGDFVLAFPPNPVLDGSGLVLEGEVINSWHRLMWQEHELRSGRYMLMQNDTVVWESKAGKLRYEWQSSEPMLERAVYQLRWIDDAGNMKRSNLVELNEPGTPFIAFFADDAIQGASHSVGMLELFDISGKKILAKSVQVGSFRIDWLGKPGGIYYVRWIGNGKASTRILMID
jgi:hypothetical protein